MSGRAPHLSLVLPCYNEEACLAANALALHDAFVEEGVRLELVLVDNGSTDSTGRIIDALRERGLPVVKVAVPVNRGYGHGIRAGLERCTAPLVGYLCADGQVAPEDVVRTYRLMEGREERVLAKVRRRFRQDSWKRKLVSVNYNLLLLGTFGWLGALDVNGSPKIFSRASLERMRLVSDDWFLDPELIIKAHELGLRVIEIDVEGYARSAGVSHVRHHTVLEFLRNIARYRAGAPLRAWRRSLAASGAPAGHAPPATHPRFPRQGRPGGALEQVRVLTQPRHQDTRGYLQKVLTSTECDGHPPRGEVYVTSARPGEAKGNHYHSRMGEWFSVVQGEGTVEIVDPGSARRMAVAVSAAEPRSVYVPPGLAHAVVNHGGTELVCVAWAEAEHDPADVHPYPVWPPAPVGSSIPVHAAILPQPQPA
ncbi:MAG TPA: glycosyltransferase [Longimicrobium sp.]|nr:glycosyltransferase [Longimicrobium sp.]